MKTQTIKSILAVAAILLAMTLTGCKKDTIEPANVPAVPVTPPVQVSVKPISIVTTNEAGAIVRTQSYRYDAAMKLVNYVSKAGTVYDSISLTSPEIRYTSRSGSAGGTEKVSFNTDGTFKESTFGNGTFVILRTFQNNGIFLDRVSNITGAGTGTMIRATYTNGLLSGIVSDLSWSITYYEALPYQKGINEFPFFYAPIKYYKVLEQEAATTTFLNNKLYKRVIIVDGNDKDIHNFSYAPDVQGRVRQVTDVITSTKNNITTQSTLVHTISYDAL